MRQDEIALKRQALNIASQLPDNPAEAAQVLQYALELVGEFWPNGKAIKPKAVETGQKDGRIVDFRAMVKSPAINRMLFPVACAVFATCVTELLEWVINPPGTVTGALFDLLTG